MLHEKAMNRIKGVNLQGDRLLQVFQQLHRHAEDLGAATSEMTIRYVEKGVDDIGDHDFLPSITFRIATLGND